MEEKILIDRKTLKAISSDTRFDILKLLKKQQHTLSEISEILKLSAPTVKEHIDKLISVDLIVKKTTKYKWKYYYLSEKGEKLLAPKSINVLITFVVSLIATVGIFGKVILNGFTRNSNISDSINYQVENVMVKTTPQSIESTTQIINQGGVLPVINNVNIFLIILGVLFLILTIFLLIVLIKKNKENKMLITNL